MNADLLGLGEAVEEMTGVRAFTPPQPMRVTPVGAARIDP